MSYRSTAFFVRWHSTERNNMFIYASLKEQGYQYNGTDEPWTFPTNFSVRVNSQYAITRTNGNPMGSSGQGTKGQMWSAHYISFLRTSRKWLLTVTQNIQTEFIKYIKTYAMIGRTWKVFKCGVGEGWRRSVGPIMWEMKKCYLEWVSRGISYTK
jgi:hypothetical protein